MQTRPPEASVPRVADKLEQVPHEFVPLASGQVDGRNGRYDLSGERSRSNDGRAEGLEGRVLDRGFDLGVERQPALADVVLS